MTSFETIRVDVDPRGVGRLTLDRPDAKNAMSQQLMRLRADGLVASRREGTTVYYRITQPEVVAVVQALHDAFCRPGKG